MSESINLQEQDAATQHPVYLEEQAAVHGGFDIPPLPHTQEANGAEPTQDNADELTAKVVATASTLFDAHVQKKVAEVGDEITAHVSPTITAVVDSARQTVAKAAALQEESRTLRGTIDDAATRIQEADSQLEERVSQVEALVRGGEERVSVLERASADQVVAAIRQVKAEGTPEERLVVTRLEKTAQPTHAHFPLLKAAIEANVPAWLHGEAGSGKSTAAAQVAEHYGLDYRFVQANPTTSESKLLGFIDAGGNYRRTGLRQVVEGGGVFLIDEIDNGTPAALTTLNALLANGHGEFPDALVPRHPNTRFVAAANTVGKGANAQYVGRNPIDAATIDRFAFIPWNIDEGLENTMVGLPYDTPPIKLDEGGVPTPAEWKDTVRATRSAVGDLALRHLVTPRATLYGSQLAQAGVGRKWLAEMTLFKGMKEQERSKIESRLGVRNGW